LKADVSIIGIVDPPHHCSGYRRIRVGVLIGQIKLTRFHVCLLCLPGGAGSNGTTTHLFTMSKDPGFCHRGDAKPKLCLFDTHSFRAPREPAIAAQPLQKNGGA